MSACERFSAMKLLIDIGNTRTKWVVADRGKLSARGALLNVDLADSQFNLPKQACIESVWASCVGGEQHFSLVSEKIRAQLGLSINRARVRSTQGGLENEYRVLDRLGVDRWVAAIGARDLVAQGHLIVIDAGTAVTIDAVSSANRFVGGVILPGARMMHDVLVGNTAGVSSVPYEINSVIGKSTEECVNSGALYGLVGAIERVVSEIQNDLTISGKSAKAGLVNVLICGGDAEKLIGLLPAHYRHEPDTLFNGLRVISQECHDGSQTD